MDQYKFVAVEKNGKRVSGRLTAENPEELLKELSARGLVCLGYENLSESSTTKKVYQLKIRELVVFCRQFETMLSAGMAVTRVFEILCDKTEKRAVKQLYYRVYESIQKGNAISGAMREQHGAFPPLLIDMISAGEESGTLDNIMKKMCQHYDRELKVHNKLRTASIYPTILVVVALLVVVLLFTMVLPQLFSVFGTADLPGSTRFLMALSNSLIDYWYLYVVGVVLVVLIWQALKALPRVRLFIDKAKIKFPKLGKLMTIIYTSRFADSMAVLYSSGLPIIQTVTSSVGVLQNTYITSKFAGAIESIGSGHPLAASIEGTGLFDSLLYPALYIGEETGNLDHILTSIAQYYDTESDTAINSLLALLEPCLMVVLGLIIGFIIAAVVVPMYTMYGSIL